MANDLLENVIGITMGDGAGIGPELILRVLADARSRPNCVVYGSSAVFELTRKQLANAGVGPMPVVSAVPLGQWRADRDAGRGVERTGGVHVIDVTDELPKSARKAIKKLKKVPFGRRYEPFAHLQLAALDSAIADAQCGRVAALCTAPITKSLFADADLPPTGHTEILADRTESKKHVMMLAGDVLRVALVTTHLPIAKVSKAVSKEAIGTTIEVTAKELRRLFGIKRPRIAVTALNPHAGERGTMGREEIDVIEPAISKARDAGIKVKGPYAADALFTKLTGGRDWRFDAVVAMYHDQALIPLKLLHFGKSANITLGLPIVRTSVDHGTAYDIAGKGVADSSSLRYAIQMADRFGRRVVG